MQNHPLPEDPPAVVILASLGRISLSIAAAAALALLAHGLGIWP